MSLTGMYRHYELRKIHRHIVKVSQTDVLTGLSNDAMGYLMVDMVLKDTARLTVENIRDRYRRPLGGEEFRVLCPETTSEAAAVVAERIRSAMENHALPPEAAHYQYRHRITAAR